MPSLAKLQCDSCSVPLPLLSDVEIAAFAAQLPLWQMADRQGMDALERVFTFDDFAGVLAFVNKVGLIAEAEHHHPILLLEWGKVTVTWWTHYLNALHRNDFILAARTDALFA